MINNMVDLPLVTPCVPRISDEARETHTEDVSTEQRTRPVLVHLAAVAKILFEAATQPITVHLHTQATVLKKPSE